MKTAFVTGANGFLGRNLIAKLIEEKVHVYALVLEGEIPSDILQSEFVSILYGNLESGCSLQGSIPKNIDVFYHFAWIGVSPEQRNIFDVQIRNINMTLNTVKFAIKKKVRKFILPGSTNEYLYSGKLINKDSVPTPRNAYGSVKVSLRYLVNQMCLDNEIDFCYCCITGIYSEFRRDNNVISYTIQTLLKNEKPRLTKLEQTWDYIHISDAVDALFLVGEKGKNGAFYGIGHGDNWKLINYVKIIHEIINKDIELGIGEILYDYDVLPSSCIDLTDIKKDTGFVPQIDFNEGIKKVINNWDMIK